MLKYSSIAAKYFTLHVDIFNFFLSRVNIFNVNIMLTGKHLANYAWNFTINTIMKQIN